MIKIILGDITKIKSEVIVNASNEDLVHGGGVAKAIANAAGRELVNESNKIIAKRGILSVGKAVYTSSGKLKKRGIKYVIHVAGPRGTKTKILEKTIKNVFELAKGLNIKSIALPAISCGVFGFDKKKGSKIIFDIAKKYEICFDIIYLVSINSEIVGYWRKLQNEQG